MNKEEYESNLIKSVIASIEKNGGTEYLSAIVLTGSFGREEPTYEIDDIGNFYLKSDVEIALIYPESNKKAIIDKLIKDVSREFDEDLNLMPITEKRIRKAYNFNFSFRVPKYKTVFTYDLFNGSKTIWGHDFINEIYVDINDVDVYEAKRLVANRIGELIYIMNRADMEHKEFLQKQWKGKLVLAIVSAWLICERNYVSSYYGQYYILEKNHNKVDKVMGSGFFADYCKVFAFLREGADVYEVADEILYEYVKNIAFLFKSRKINKPRVNSISRVAKYYIKYVKTDMKFGIMNFEDRILQALIDSYCMKNPNLVSVADIWHEVLY